MCSRRSFLPLVVLLLSAVAASAVVSRSLERSFPLGGPERPRLSIRTFYGNILIEAGEAPEIKVRVRQDFEAIDDAGADRIAKNLKLGFEAAGQTLLISAEYSRKLQWSQESWPPVKLSYTVVVPKACDLDVFTRDGSVTIGLLCSKARVRTQYGLISFKGIEGDIDASSEFGDVVVAHCKGGLKLRSVSGSFQVGPVTGFADVSGHGGEIEVESSGGGIRAETSGADLSVGFRHPIVSPATLKTGGASIIITLDKRSTCSLDLRASVFGKVISVKDALPLTSLSGTPGRSSKVHALMNGGGPKIEARASGGHIYLQAAPEDR